MSIILFVFIPLAWALTGQLLGLAFSAVFFYGAAAKRRGRTVSRWAVWLLPLAYFGLCIGGGEGNAGRGVTLFGTDALLEIFAVTPMVAVVVLGGFAGVVYVVRDLTVGHRADRTE